MKYCRLPSKNDTHQGADCILTVDYIRIVNGVSIRGYREIKKET